MNRPSRSYSPVSSISLALDAHVVDDELLPRSRRVEVEAERARRSAPAPPRVSSNDMNTPGSPYSIAPRTRNSIANSVLPQPALPQTSVGRPRQPAAGDLVETLDAGRGLGQREGEGAACCSAGACASPNSFPWPCACPSPSVGRSDWFSRSNRPYASGSPPSTLAAPRLGQREGDERVAGRGAEHAVAAGGDHDVLAAARAGGRSSAWRGRPSGKRPFQSSSPVSRSNARRK